MSEKEELQKLRQSIERRIARLQLIIEGIDEELQSPIEDKGQPAMETRKPSVGGLLPMVTPGEFIHWEPAKAAKVVLSRAGIKNPLSTKVLSERLQKGGVSVERNFYRRLATSPLLKIVLKNKDDKDKTLWGLRAWYPSKSKKKEKVQPEGQTQATPGLGDD